MDAEHPLQKAAGGDGRTAPPAAAPPRVLPPVEICAHCHQPMMGRGPRGGCLRCALRVALTDDPDTDRKEPIPPGEDAGQSSPPSAAVSMRMRYGHFEVALGADNKPVELGSGAMATTYRATDTTLHLPVALKIISRNVASRPGARARFLREARAAARLHHPNVASVIYHGEQDGECFYAVELVEGETLAERVRRAGVFTAGEALEIGVQVARALAAAEAHGIIHRDLKPSNLMLVSPSQAGPGTPPGAESNGMKPSVPPLRIKVIDWGLAKVVSAEPEGLEADQTRGAFVGTPAFASPEQFASIGERFIDTRSDIYSLGVTLWYLLCGRVPFVDNTLEGIHARQQALPLEQLKTAKVPGRLAQMLKSMLAFEPADRPQSARELLDALLRCQERHRERRPSTVQRKRFLQAGVVLVLLALGAGAWRQHQKPPALRAPSEEISLAVLPFENLSADPANAFFTTGVYGEITHALAYVAALHVINTGSTRSYLPESRNLPVIGRDLGVRYLLEGRVRREGNQIDVRVKLVDLHGQDSPWSRQYTRQVNEASLVQGEIARAVTEHLRVVVSGAERAAIDRPPTTNPAAYDLYLRVHDQLPLLQSYQENQRYYQEIMVPTLESAVALDPDFAFAHCDLMVAYLNMVSYEVSRDQAEAAAKHRAQAEAALAKARTLRPDAGEVHQAQETYYMEYVSNNELTRRELELARRGLPNNAAVEHAMGVLAQKENRWDEAVACFERALSLDPRNNVQRWNFVVLCRELRRYEEADRELGRVIAATPASGSTAYRLNLAVSKIEAQGDLTPFRQTLDDIVPTNSSSGDVINRGRMMLAVLSHDPEAVSKLLAANQTELLYDLSPAPRAWFKALAARMRHDEPAAQTAFQAARIEMERKLQTDPTNNAALGLLAIIDAGLGRKEEAVREAVHACEMGTNGGAGQFGPLNICNLAVVYAWTGQPDRACETLEPWITKPAGLVWPMQPTYGDFKCNPVWDPLRGYPRFEALVARLAPAK